MSDMNSIILICVSAILFIALVALFFVSRRSQRVMDSLLQLLMSPDRAKIKDAARVVKSAMSTEIENLESSFAKMGAFLEERIAQTAELNREMNDKTASLRGTAEMVSSATDDFGSALAGLKKVISSDGWGAVSKTLARFQDTVSELLVNIDSVVNDADQKTKSFNIGINEWIESGAKLNARLSSDLESGTAQMNAMVVEGEALQTRLDDLAKSVAGGFNEVKSSAANYEKIMTANEKLLGGQLTKMDAFTKQSKTLLVKQVNTLTDAADTIGARIRLAESSIENQTTGLRAATGDLTESAQTIETFVKNIGNEISILTGKFQNEIREFAENVVVSLNAAGGAADSTLESTRSAAAAFTESVRAMAGGVQNTVAEMNAAHAHLADQSAGLVKLSSETMGALTPLNDLVEKYYAALPQITSGSAEMTDKIETLRGATETSLISIADSSLKLEHLSGESRQQMIELLADYARAVDTMQTLNRQMQEARATAPMAAIVRAGESRAPTVGVMDTADFMKQSEVIIAKLHEQSVDLTQSIGAQIPDAVWKKYHAGDKTIFSKWFAKILSTADKKRVRELLKSDSVFRSQATQFVRSFGKMLRAAELTGNKEMLNATFLKTDLGQMYLALKSFVE
ncbi:MAG: hypothetical protein LBO08_03430 [Rickettsiales bacterium]|jgi:methyl-accepting chemotaxis protein|nr:hypothetical protein [Rickettsiales bacterium]